MIEKNDPKKGRFHRKASTNEDLEQAKNLLLANSVKNSAPAKNTEDNEFIQTRLRIEAEAKKLADLLGVSAVSQIRDIEESLLRAEVENDPNIMKHVVHYYTDHYWSKYANEISELHGIDRNNLLDRPYYRKDDDCSRDDYTQFIRLMQAGMEDVDNLKEMMLFGQVKDCPTDIDVYATRRRKSRLVENMINYIREMYEWVSDEHNHKALTSVPMYWLTQTYAETKKYGTGYMGPIDYVTGQVVAIKKNKTKTGK
jgi:hypothetical protein